jgi:NADH-quinone oxidoreductase subunit E
VRETGKSDEGDFAMSTFSMPETLIPDARTMEAQLKKMQDDLNAMMPKEFAGAANLMAHPMAAAAAGSALGLAFASHAFGLWAGAVAGSVEASQRMFGLDDEGGGVESFRAPGAAAARARAAAKTLIADVEKAAKDTAAVAAKVAEASVDDAAEAVARAVAAPLTITDSIRAERPHLPDDLKAITGIGPKLEHVLNDLGIWTYSQVAGWSEEQVAWLDEHLGFRGRIGRDDWIGQAKNLAGGAKH